MSHKGVSQTTLGALFCGVCFGEFVSSVAAALRSESGVLICKIPWSLRGPFEDPRRVSHKPQVVSLKPHLGPDSNAVSQYSAVLVDCARIYVSIYIY